MMPAMSTATAAQVTTATPLLPESSSSESVGVDTVMSDLKDQITTIPDYQRDGNQWDIESKSLLVESVINNLTIPAIFLESKIEDGVERSEVVDGQQRLTTLQAFYEGQFALVKAEDAPYLSPNSVHYAGKKFDELPAAYKQAFKKYRLTVIRLRNSGPMRLEVFRRINQGGTPLSGQDTRLAYFGEGSPSVAFVRLVGIHDKSSFASSRFISTAKERYGISFPWNENLAFDSWSDWWLDKEIARGQTPSEMFLWSLVCAQANEMDALLSNDGALKSLNVRFNNIVSEVLDTYCAQCEIPRHPRRGTFPSIAANRNVFGFFPHFQDWIDFLLRQAGVSLSVGKHRLLGCVIGIHHQKGVRPPDLTADQATQIVSLIRSPTAVAEKHQVAWPKSKGRWSGDKGSRAQIHATDLLVAKILGDEVPLPGKPEPSRSQ